MTLVTLDDCYGFDTDAPLTHATAASLAAATYHGHPIRFAIRYVSFTQPFPGDLSSLEAGAITGAGLVLLVVCHPPNPRWTASGQLGRSHGAWAAKNALAAGYAQGCHLFVDLEGLANSGGPVSDYANEWCSEVAQAGYDPAVYVGFDAGLNASELYALPLPTRYWSDDGNRQVAARGCCMHQGPTVTIAGVSVDPDHHSPDAFGGCLVGMGASIAVG